MLSFDEFKMYVDRLNIYTEYEGKLADLGIDIWEREEVAKLVSGYIDLIAIGLNLDISRDPLGYDNDFFYWFYELEQGTQVDCYFNEDEPEYDGLGTDLEKVYNFLVKND